MLRITEVRRKSDSGLKLEGKLTGPWVEETKQCWLGAKASNKDGAVKLNVEGLTYVDERGKDLLLQMQREGASFEGASEYLRSLLGH